MSDPKPKITLARLEDSTLEDFRNEIDDYYGKLLLFHESDASEILQTLSGLTARASFIRSHIIRRDDRMLQNFRTKELDPFISECDRQFKIWSRLISANQFEWEMSRG